ncbi:late competence development ComFB family protein [Pseudanabaena sp. PCC 6802]|uniref:late competence development ComFB family protein n=1 Tax=Pseudanabaena sp. PCC 6802 TaxID=118173 RepID=UPI000346281E|nr:late competence development ComFB family protein [Pseudanabaena sp. PCC 6802]
MSGFKNVIEDIVVKNATAQLDNLRADIKQQISISEIAAFALNRLPPLYVTTEIGWAHQHNRALNDLEEEIFNNVRRAIAVLQIGDPLHDHTPLPEDELFCKARSLVKLGKILEREQLRWRDVPSALLAVMQTEKEEPVIEDETTLQESIKHLSRGKRSAVIDIKGYLQRSKRRMGLIQLRDASWTDAIKAVDSTAIEYEELGSYVLKAQLGFSNVLEKLVVLVAQHLMRDVPPEVSSQIDMTEIAAYALNRLPPMYATSARGYQLLRQRAQVELTKEITAQVRQAILKVGRSPKHAKPPLPLAKFEKEYDLALEELKQILNRPDLTSQNVVEIVEATLAARANELTNSH